MSQYRLDRISQAIVSHLDRENPMPEPTIEGIHEMADSHYREYPAVAHSDLKRLAGGESPKGRHLLIGQAFHHALLQPQLARDIYCTTPEDWNLVSREGKQKLREYEEEQAKIAIRPKERALIVSLCKSVMHHEQARRIVKAEGQCEAAVISELKDGILCKGRIDKILSKCLVDLKTTGYGTQEEFEQAIVDYNYDSQGAFYSDLYREVTNEFKPFVWVVVSKRSFDCWVTQLQPYHLATGRRWYRDMLAVYANQRSGVQQQD